MVNGRLRSRRSYFIAIVAARLDVVPTVIITGTEASGVTSSATIAFTWNESRHRIRRGTEVGQLRHGCADRD